MVSISPTIQPQVEYKFNHRFVPAASATLENQPMVNSVGQLIKDALSRMGKTQAWLAEKVGVSDNAVSKWIRSGQISRENIPMVARLLGLYPDELLPPIDWDKQQEPSDKHKYTARNQDERDLLDGFRAAGPERREDMLEAARRSIKIAEKAA